jgi:hypothetical protein
VSFGPNGALSFVDNDLQITATSPAGTGTVDIVVTPRVGSSANGPSERFTYF